VPNATNAAVSLSSIVATVETTAAGAVYHISVQLKESGGRSGATITGMTFTLQRGTATLFAAYTPIKQERIAAGDSLGVGPVNVTDTAGALVPTASDISVDVRYTDDGGGQGAVTGKGAVEKVLKPTVATYTVGGVVTDGTSGPSGRMPNATVQVLDGPNAGRTTVTDATGNYELSGLDPGAATLSASMREYETVSTEITIPSNTRVDFVLRRLPMDLAGTWTGDATDSKGTIGMNWTISQSGANVSGTVSTQFPNDGSCNSCHRNKSGTFSGTIDGTTLVLNMFFGTGTAGDPTPACSVTLSGTASDVTPFGLTFLYSGEDTCEGPFLSGTAPMTRSR
jgi:hypothetical protein